MIEWNLEQKRIKVDYMGVICTGLCVESRVKYGGSVQHTVELDEPIKLQWRTDLKKRVLVDSNEVVDLLV